MLPDVTPDEIAQYATDGAPVERAMLEHLSVDVIRQSQNSQLGEDVRAVALMYAREAADKAFMLGYRLGHDEGRVDAAKPGRESAIMDHGKQGSTTAEDTHGAQRAQPFEYCDLAGRDVPGVLFDELTPAQQDEVRTVYKYADAQSWTYHVDEAGAIIGRRAVLPAILARLGRLEDVPATTRENVLNTVDHMIGLAERMAAEAAEVDQPA